MICYFSVALMTKSQISKVSDLRMYNIKYYIYKLIQLQHDEPHYW